MRNHKRTLLVYADWQGIDGPVLMGELHSERLKGKEIFSFEYDEEWLGSDQLQLIDPDLQFYSGLQHHSVDRKNFGLFLDSSPDRWGRVLMRRRESALARKEKRAEQNLFETDYLLGVYDAHRMGGLRYKLEKEGPFLDNNKELASPPWASLSELEQISLKLEQDEISDDPDYLKWLNILMAPGASLGGARPKASVVAKDGCLWIAKFPSRNDGEDIGAWEMVTYQLALAAGINMAESKTQKFSSNHHTFLTKRFDRTNDGIRLHFASAMTLLGYSDGNDHHDGVSYLELAEFISTHGANPSEDLEQLWRRIVFNICVSNTDDHLRNHGFVLTESGWKLSPAFDINPVATGTGLKLNISDNDNSLDIDLAMEVYPYFRLSSEQAIVILEEVKASVKDWKKLADKLGISKANQELKALAFSRAQGE